MFNRMSQMERSKLSLSESMSSHKSSSTDEVTKAPAVTSVGSSADYRRANTSVDDLRKEYSKLSTTNSRKIEPLKHGAHKNSNAMSVKSMSKLDLKPDRKPKSKSVGFDRNGLTKLVKSASIDNKLSDTDKKTHNDTDKKNRDSDRKISGTDKKVDEVDKTDNDEEKNNYQTWLLENRDYLLQNPFTLKDFQLDAPTCHCCACRSRSKVDQAKAAVGKLAPYFETQACVDGQLCNVKLTDYAGKYVVLLFYIRDFADSVCLTELVAFSDKVESFSLLNCQILACSTDSHYAHLAWVTQSVKDGGLGPMAVPMLSDATHQISKDYGVFRDDSGSSGRGTVVIDTKGMLRHFMINDGNIGRDVDEVLRLVRALKHSDEQNVACPVGWRPGRVTLKKLDDQM